MTMNNIKSAILYMKVFVSIKYLRINGIKMRLPNNNATSASIRDEINTLLFVNERLLINFMFMKKKIPVNKITTITKTDFENTIAIPEIPQSELY